MQDHSSPGGLIGDAFEAAGCDVSEMVVVPKERYHSPDVAVTFPSPSEYDAVVFFGAVWSVYDTATIPWVSAEIKYARSLISLGVPALGICSAGNCSPRRWAAGWSGRRSRRSDGCRSPQTRRPSRALSTLVRGCHGTLTGFP